MAVTVWGDNHDRVEGHNRAAGLPRADGFQIPKPHRLQKPPHLAVDAARESVFRHHALIVRIGLRVGSSVRDAARLKQPIAELREFHRFRVVHLVAKSGDGLSFSLFPGITDYSSFLGKSEMSLRCGGAVRTVGPG